VIPRFYPILDVEFARRRGLFVVDTAREIVEAGARILQFRYKGFWSRDVFADLECVAGLCREAGAMLIVNDRVDVAAVVGGAGVHLGQEDLTPVDARRVVGSEVLIGFSTHNERQMREAALQPADYVAFGPVFPTATKENPDPVVGIAELRRLRPMTTRPLVAIGGITRANACAVIEAGADSVAVIGDLFPETGSIRKRVREWRAVLGN
jgi:thiamine-phosphate pyrophosphorylase